MNKVTAVSVLSGVVLSAGFFLALTASVGHALQPNAGLLSAAVSCQSGVAGNPGKALMCGVPAQSAEPDYVASADAVDFLAAHAGSVAERNG